MDLAQRAALLAARHAEGASRLDLRDRSEPDELRHRSEPDQIEPGWIEPARAELAPIVAPGGTVPGFVCPRCGATVEGADFYGPCQGCRAELRTGATVSGAPRQGCCETPA